MSFPKRPSLASARAGSAGASREKPAPPLQTAGVGGAADNENPAVSGKRKTAGKATGDGAGTAGKATPSTAGGRGLRRVAVAGGTSDAGSGTDKSPGATDVDAVDAYDPGLEDALLDGAYVEASGEGATPVASDKVASAKPASDKHSGSKHADERSGWDRWGVAAGTGQAGDPWGICDCPQCLAGKVKDTLLVESGGTRFYCVRCGFHGDASQSPDTYTSKAPVAQVRWPEGKSSLNAVLSRNGFDPSDIERLGVGLDIVRFRFEDGGWRDAVAVACAAEPGAVAGDFLFTAIGKQCELLPLQARLPRGDAVPFGWERVTPETDELLFVETLADWLAASLAYDDGKVLTLPPTLNPARVGGGDYRALAVMEQRLKTISRVRFGFANDDYGHRLEEDLSRRMGRDRCFRTHWIEHPVEGVGSAWAVLRKYGKAGVAGCIEAMAPYPVAGIHELVDVADEYEAYYEIGFLPGAKVGLPSIDNLYSVPLGQVTLVHGVPGHGKSTLVDDFVVRLGRRYGWRFGVLSPENQPIARHFAAFTEKYIGKPFVRTAGETRMTPAEKDEGKRWVNEHIRMVMPDDENGNWTVDGVLDLARTLVYRHGIRGLVIDPWNELDHARSAAQTYEDYLGHALTKIKRFARINELHVFIVAHPVKLDKKADGHWPVPTPYNVSGGAMWFNKCDFILVPYRNRGDVDEEIADIHVQKVRQREHGRIGRTALRYDTVRNRYIDDVDAYKREQSIMARQPLATREQLLGHEREDTPMERTDADLLGLRKAHAARAKAAA